MHVRLPNFRRNTENPEHHVTDLPNGAYPDAYASALMCRLLGRFLDNAAAVGANVTMHRDALVRFLMDESNKPTQIPHDAPGDEGEASARGDASP